MKNILHKLQPIVARRGKVAFSIFIDDAYRLENPGAYGFADCYGRVWFSEKQLKQLCAGNGWVAAEKETFLAQEVNLHRIFALAQNAAS